MAYKDIFEGEDGMTIPEEVLNKWKQDISEVAGEALEKARYSITGSACFFSFSIAKYRRFLEVWDALQKKYFLNMMSELLTSHWNITISLTKVRLTHALIS